MIASLSMPPERYDHPPRTAVPVVSVDPALIEGFCPIENGMVLGCYREASGKIFIRDDLTAKARAKVLRHEYGHVNGWKH